MESPTPDLAVKLIKEANILYYSNGKEATELSAVEIVKKAGAFKEATLGVDFRGVPAGELEEEARRNLPLIVNGLSRYLHSTGEVQKLISENQRIVKRAEKEKKEYEEHLKEQIRVQEIRDAAKEEIKTANDEANAARLKAKLKLEDEIKAEVEKKRGIENAYRSHGLDKDATPEEIENEYQRQLLEHDTEAIRVKMALEGKSEEEIEDEVRKKTISLEQLQHDHEILIDKEKRAEHDKKLESISTEVSEATPKEQADEGIILKFIPQVGAGEETQEIKRARSNSDLIEFNENVQNSGYVNLSSTTKQKLKRHEFVPNEFSDSETDDTVNLALLTFSKVGDARELQKAIDNNTDLPPAIRNKLQLIANNVAALQVSNPTLARNIHAASGFAQIEISSGKINKKSQTSGELHIQQAGDLLSPAVENIKTKAQEVFKKDIVGFIEKSFGSKAAKKVASVIAMRGLDVTVHGFIASLATATGPLAPIIEAILEAAYWVLKKVFGALIAKVGRAVQKFMKENKEAVLLAGLGLGGVGLATGSVPLIAGGATMIGGLVITGGPALAAAATNIVAGFTIAAVVGAGLGTIAWILAAVILFTLFTMYIINTSGYVVPINYEQGALGVTPPDCIGTPPPKPAATGVRFSADGKYAYPVAPFEVPGYSCYHWDGNKAADIFSPTSRVPLVAYEDARVVNVTLNDSLGGKYVILEGLTSGRFYYYAHMCHVYVSGGTVRAGEVIGTMDETGNGRVQHLHFAINNSSTFSGGDGNVCPQEDFETKFDFGVCTQFCWRSSL